MWRNKGFVWIETLLSVQAVLVLALVLIPLYTKILQDKKDLQAKLDHAQSLYNKLSEVVYQDSNQFPIYKKEGDGTTMIFTVDMKEPFVKGCVFWTNEKGDRERFCLYQRRKE